MSGEGTKESGQGTSGLQLPSSNISRPYRGAGILQPRGQGVHEAPEMPLASALWRGFSNSLFKGGRGDLEVVSFLSQEACMINNNNTEKKSAIRVPVGLSHQQPATLHGTTMEHKSPTAGMSDPRQI